MPDKPPPKPDDWQHPDYRERRFTWHEGDLVFVKPGDGVPLLTPEELEAAITHHEPAKQAHREAVSNVDYPPDEDVDYPENERSKP